MQYGDVVAYRQGSEVGFGLVALVAQGSVDIVALNPNQHAKLHLLDHHVRLVKGLKPADIEDGANGYKDVATLDDLNDAIEAAKPSAADLDAAAAAEQPAADPSATSPVNVTASASAEAGTTETSSSPAPDATQA